MQLTKTASQSHVCAKPMTTHNMGNLHTELLRTHRPFSDHCCHVASISRFWLIKPQCRTTLRRDSINARSSVSLKRANKNMPPHPWFSEAIVILGSATGNPTIITDPANLQQTAGQISVSAYFGIFQPYLKTRKSKRLYASIRLWKLFNTRIRFATMRINKSTRNMRNLHCE